MNSSVKDPNQKDDKKVKRSKQEVYELLLRDVEVARKSLLDGKPGRATEIAHTALMSYKEELGGENSVLLLPGYFIQAECYISEGKLKKAEEYLVAAKWAYVQYNKPKDKASEEEKVSEDITEDQNTLLGGQLHKIFSKLYMAQKDNDKALEELKLGIYIDSVKYGPEHINTSLNYYYMGMIFQQKKQVPEAESLFAKMSEVWFRFLKAYFKNQLNYQDQLPDEITVKEALQLLKNIEEYFRKYQEDSRRVYLLPITKNFQAQALIYKLLKEDEKFRNYMGLAYQEFLTQRGENDKKTKKISEFVEAIKQREY